MVGGKHIWGFIVAGVIHNSARTPVVGPEFFGLYSGDAFFLLLPRSPFRAVDIHLAGPCLPEAKACAEISYTAVRPGHFRNGKLRAPGTVRLAVFQYDPVARQEC